MSRAAISSTPSTFRSQYDWSERYLETMKHIIGPHLLTKAPFEVDVKENADLVLKVADMRIACRVRTPGYSEAYPNQFTIRSFCRGYRTEFAKVMEGLGDWFFYGHALDYESVIITPWWIIDLDAFREHMRETAQMVGLFDDEPVYPLIYRKHVPNGDGTKFHAFRIHDFPDDPPLLITSERQVAIGHR